MRVALVIALLAAVAAGCVSKSKARLREQESFLKGQQQVLNAQQQAQEPVVWFRGLIRHSRVPWRENFTLSKGILAAQYTGSLDPSSIRIIRRGQAYPVNVKLLLRGEDDPVLEPGDIVEVLR